MATSTQINAITALYVGYFDRAPDPAGLQFWIDQIDDGREFNTIAADFAASPEAVALYPYLTTPDVSSPAVFVTNIYANLFGRTPDQEGLDFWTGVLEDGSVSVADMIEAIIMGARDDADAGTFDKSVLDNKVEVGLDFALETGNVPGFEFDAAAKAAAVAAVNGVTEDEATVAQAKAATDAYVAGDNVPGAGDTFTLTTDIGEEVVGTAGNDKFNVIIDGDDTTLNTFDSVDGGAGQDTMNILVDGEVTVAAGASVQNVEIINMVRTNAVETDAVNAAAFGAAAEQLWQIGEAGDIEALADGQAAGFRNLAELDATVSYDDDASSAVVALDNVVSGSAIEISGEELDTVTVSGTVADDEGDAGSLALSFDGDADDGVTTLNLALANDTVLTADGSFNTIVTVDASASTGAITAELSGSDAFESIIGGSGDDDLTVGGTFSADAVSINGGAGADLITVDASDTDTAINITLGAGEDRVAFTSLANLSEEGDLEDSLITIADFNAADDVLDLEALGVYDELANDEAAEVSGAASLEAAVAKAADYADEGFTLFDYAGDAYVYADGEGAGLIKVTDMSVEDFDSSALIVGSAPMPIIPLESA